MVFGKKKKKKKSTSKKSHRKETRIFSTIVIEEEDDILITFEARTHYDIDFIAASTAQSLKMFLDHVEKAGIDPGPHGKKIHKALKRVTK